MPTGQAHLAGEAQNNLARQLELAGVTASQFPDPADYNMIIGVATTQNSIADLLKRVAFGGPTGGGDESTNGGFTAESQPLYASLRGTQTTRLDCHSNGAMVCLAALTRGDVVAQNVRLFGPQITPSALQQWDSLVKTGRINSLEINMTNGDPIAPVSYGFGAAPLAYTKSTVIDLAKDWSNYKNFDAFSPDGPAKLKAEIQQIAPAVHVNVFDDPGCRAKLDDDKFACHSMRLYQNLTRQ